jgi:hypothetical protein
MATSQEQAVTIMLFAAANSSCAACPAPHAAWPVQAWRAQRDSVIPVDDARRLSPHRSAVVQHRAIVFIEYWWRQERHPPWPRLAATDAAAAARELAATAEAARAGLWSSIRRQATPSREAACLPVDLVARINSK